MIVGIAGETSVEAEEELIATLTPDWEKRTLAQLMVMAGDEKCKEYHDDMRKICWSCSVGSSIRCST